MVMLSTPFGGALESSVNSVLVTS